MKGPKAPDPYKTAAAQGAQNRQTATTEYQLGATDQITPYGNLSYEQTGAWADGTPRFRATTTLSPDQQRQLDLENRFGVGARETALQQLGNVREQFGKPVDLSNEAVEGRLWELGRKRLDPMFAEQRSSLETDLINRGIRPGTAAYDAMTRQFGEGKNDAYNQLALTGRQQAVAEALTARNQPLNEFNALLSSNQIQNPNFVNTPSPNVQGVDLAGMIYKNYDNKVAQHNAMMGGLFGLGAAATKMVQPFKLF